MTEVVLEPQEGIGIVDGRLSVLSAPAWLKITPLQALTGHRWVRIRYSSGMFDPLTRPILRLRTKDGRVHYNFMTGAILGSSEWIGRIPKNTVEASINPTQHRGPFSFRIDQIQSISRLELLARGFVSHPHRTYISITKRLTNARQASWDLLKFVNGSTPFARYHEWHRRFVRPVDPTGFDRPRHDWSKGPEIVMVAKLGSHQPADVRRTLASLQAQLFRRWRLFVVFDEAASESARRAFIDAAKADDRLQEIESGAWPTLDADALIATISFGDQLSKIALASFADAAADHPEWQAIYSDEDSISESRLHSPILKPDWSPVLNTGVGYLGQLTFLKVRLVQIPMSQLPTDVSAILSELPSGAVGHLSRILYRRRRSQTAISETKNDIRSDARVKDWPGVGIILPTRDRPDLLEACIEGLKTKTDYPDFEVIIMDNGTVDVRALSILNSLRCDPRFKIIRDDRPFNYSRLCNTGVQTTKQPYLAFLNNDVRMIEPNWLKALLEICLRPDAGVVGSKLLFPNGRLQHAGVVLGVGGLVGHSYFNSPENSVGYFSELVVTREVSALTGACCAIERTKFLAVGGLDEVNFPIELNDIDLCLKIAEQGWQNYLAPKSVLTHFQSASRGVAERPSDRFAHERTHFLEKWGHVVANDPFFHPALSLFAHRPSLG